MYSMKVQGKSFMKQTKFQPSHHFIDERCDKLRYDLPKKLMTYWPADIQVPDQPYNGTLMQHKRVLFHHQLTFCLCTSGSPGKCLAFCLIRTHEIATSAVFDKKREVCKYQINDDVNNVPHPYMYIFRKLL